MKKTDADPFLLPGTYLTAVISSNGFPRYPPNPLFSSMNLKFRSGAKYGNVFWNCADIALTGTGGGGGGGGEEEEEEVAVDETPVDPEPTTPTDSSEEFMECYADKKDDRIMGAKLFDSQMTTSVCRAHCLSADLASPAMYYGTQVRHLVFTPRSFISGARQFTKPFTFRIKRSMPVCMRGQVSIKSKAVWKLPRTVSDYWDQFFHVYLHAMRNTHMHR